MSLQASPLIQGAAGELTKPVPKTANLLREIHLRRKKKNKTTHNDKTHVTGAAYIRPVLETVSRAMSPVLSTY